MITYLYFLLSIFKKVEYYKKIIIFSNINIHKKKIILDKIQSKLSNKHRKKLKNIYKKISFLYKKQKKLIDCNYLCKNNYLFCNHYLLNIVSKNKISISNKKKILFCNVIYLYYEKQIIIPLNKKLERKVKYPELFCKDLLGLNRKISKKSITKIIKKCYVFNNKYGINKFDNDDLFIHYHMFNLSNICSYINFNFIKKTIKYKIIITFCIKNFDFIKIITNKVFINNVPNKHKGNILIILNQLFVKNKLILLHVPNRGMDIGPKILCCEFLNKCNINYKSILFMHSKSNVILREKYTNSLLENLNLYEKSNIKDKLILIPNSIYYGYYDITNDDFNLIKKIFLKFPNYKGNYILLSSFMKYNYNIDIKKQKKNIFPDGNFYILPKKIIKKLFYLKNYKLLNKINDFEYNWFKIHYNLKLNLYDCYIYYLKSGKSGNALSNKNSCINTRDFMVEHLFERTIIYMKEINKDIKVILCDTKNFKYNNLINSFKVNMQRYINE